MKKNILSALLLMLAGFTFNSCSKDDADDGILNPTETFEQRCKFDARHLYGEEEPYHWYSWETDVQFKVLEGDYQGMPTVAMTRLFPIGNIFRMHFGISVNHENQLYILTTLGNQCISDASFIESVALDGYLQHVGYDVFRNATRLEELTFGPEMQTIGGCAFRGCTKLPKIEWNSLGKDKSIGPLAFAECTALETVKIEAKDGTFDSGAFEGCTSLKDVSIQGNKLDFDWSVFEDCTSLENVSIQGDNTSIGWSLFENCTSLKVVDLPSTLTQIEPNAFLGCSSLTNIIIHGAHTPLISATGLPEGCNVQIVDE